MVLHTGFEHGGSCICKIDFLVYMRMTSADGGFFQFFFD